ncbi:YolD-like protein [Paenibacillus sp. UNCCL117]|nr:YolD-like protein [Paenibacillus sp. cl123]SFW40791.1 YolD-like protein [Paenibacillus sp. UNCCL117]
MDEQEWELIAQVLYESRAYTLPCTVTIFEVYEDRQVTGVVERIDTAGDRLLLDISAGEARDIERIKLSDVLKAERS